MSDLPRKRQKCMLTGRFQKRLEADGYWATDQKYGRKRARILPAGKISREAMRGYSHHYQVLNRGRVKTHEKLPTNFLYVK
jgi:hypothetical protein